MYKTSPKICSHAIAFAEKVGKLICNLLLRVSCGSDPTGLPLSVRGINKKSSGCKGEKSKNVGTKHKGSEIVNYVPAPFLGNPCEQSAVSELLMLVQQPLRTVTNSQLNVFASQSGTFAKMTAFGN